MSTKQSIFFLGATGGCALAALKLALQEGHTCIALVRNPSKLETLLAGPTQIPTATLTIIQGDAQDQEALRKALLSNDGKMVDIIVCGIGAAPKLQASLMPVTLDNPTICATAAENIVQALQSIKPSQAPLVVAVSTTGISSKGRDVPLLLYPLYRWLLAVPHEDKHKMEAKFVEAREQKVVSAATVVRASLLMDGPATKKIRTGWEWMVRGDGVESRKDVVGETEKPAVGYTITRDDVGLWIYENIIKSASTRRTWDGKMVTLTS